MDVGCVGDLGFWGVLVAGGTSLWRGGSCFCYFLILVDVTLTTFDVAACMFGRGGLLWRGILLSFSILVRGDQMGDTLQ